MSSGLAMRYWLRKTQTNSISETWETYPGDSTVKASRSASARPLCTGSSIVKYRTRMLVSSPVICGGSIIEAQLPGPALGNRFVHFLDSYRLASPMYAALQIHD